MIGSGWHSENCRARCCLSRSLIACSEVSFMELRVQEDRTLAPVGIREGGPFRVLFTANFQEHHFY
jgi:hypothetical protein